MQVKRRWRDYRTETGRRPVKDFLDSLDDSDFVDEVVRERSRKNPAFGTMVDEAYERRLLHRKLAEARKAAHLNRTAVAARMGTSEAAGEWLEAAGRRSQNPDD